jgi:PBS lyase HEAT-like repeat
MPKLPVILVTVVIAVFVAFLVGKLVLVGVFMWLGTAATGLLLLGLILTIAKKRDIPPTSSAMLLVLFPSVVTWAMLDSGGRPVLAWCAIITVIVAIVLATKPDAGRRQLSKRWQERRSLATEVLKILNWQPTSARARALFAVARGQHDEACRQGVAAVEFLAADVRSGSTEAVRALTAIGDPSCIEPLIRALCTGVGESAAFAVVTFGSAAVTPLLDLLRTGGKVVCRLAAATLGRITLSHELGAITDRACVAALMKALVTDAGERSSDAKWSEYQSPCSPASKG